MGSYLAFALGLDKCKRRADLSSGCLPAAGHFCIWHGPQPGKRLWGCRDDHKVTKAGSLKFCFISVFKKVIHLMEQTSKSKNRIFKR